MMYTPKTGYRSNPLRKYRNNDCICGSGKKSKKCCGRGMYVSIEWGRWADEFIEYLLDPTDTIKLPEPYDKSKDEYNN